MAAAYRTSMHGILEKPMSNVSFLNRKTNRVFIRSSPASLKKRYNLKVVSAKASNQGDNSNLGDENNTRKISQRLKVAYQGVPGAYSEWAATKAYPDCKPVPYEQFEVVFNAVESGIADRAVLPIQNSLGRRIPRNYDLLLEHNLNIVGEVSLSTKHCLLANHGVRLESGEDPAKIRDLLLFGRDLQDDNKYASIFLMLAKEPVIISPAGTDRPFKTSIAFSSEEEPDMLFKAVDVFRKWQIKLTKTGVQPLHKQPMGNSGDASRNCVFYFTFEASMADPRSQNAIGQLKEFATVRVLGSYPSEGPFDDVGDWSG